MSKKIKEHIISSVLPNTIAEELGIEPKDRLISINNQPVKDVFDYQFLINDEYIELLVKKQDGQEWILEIEKEYEEDLGIEFEDGLMDEYKSCRNKCIFCFIDQMPKGMRETLYFKDDDARLSFLSGNYITLTNMSDEDIDRIILYKLAPINISIHTMNRKLRCKMLNNRFAGDALDKIDKLYKANIAMNGQIVLCKNVNDKEELDFTIKELERYLPCMESVSIVPVGITKYRENLYQMIPFTEEDAKELITQVHKWQEYFYERYNNHFIHVSDEWYILAKEEVQEEDKYDGYPQLENGVGMVRIFEDDFLNELKDLEGDTRKRKISLATGTLMAPRIEQLIKKVQEKFSNIQVQVFPIINYFFGENITVAGLLTGQDIISQLKGKDLGDGLLLPISLLRNGEDILLDDISIKDIEKALQVNVHIVQSDGKALLESILK